VSKALSLLGEELASNNAQLARAAVQFSVSLSAESMTRTSTGALVDSSLSPSCSWIAVKIEGPLRQIDRQLRHRHDGTLEKPHDTRSRTARASGFACRRPKRRTRYRWVVGSTLCHRAIDLRPMELWAWRPIASREDERIHRHLSLLVMDGELESLRQKALQHQLLASSPLSPSDHVSRCLASTSNRSVSIHFGPPES
jgi:hypothetical protein